MMIILKFHHRHQNPNQNQNQNDGKPQIGKIVNQLCINRQAGCMARITDEPSDRHADIQSKSIDNFPRHQMQLMSLEEKAPSIDFGFGWHFLVLRKHGITASYTMEFHVPCRHSPRTGD